MSSVTLYNGIKIVIFLHSGVDITGTCTSWRVSAEKIIMSENFDIFHNDCVLNSIKFVYIVSIRVRGDAANKV